MQDISLTKPPDYVGKVLATLGKLLIISQLDCTENDVSWCYILTHALYFSLLLYTLLETSLVLTLNIVISMRF